VKKKGGGKFERDDDDRLINKSGKKAEGREGKKEGLRNRQKTKKKIRLRNGRRKKALEEKMEL